MLKKHLISLLALGVLTACGGGSSGSSDGDDSSNGGNNNTPRQLTFSNTNLAYLSVFHGKRDGSSSFTEYDFTGETETTLTLSDKDGHISLAVACTNTKSTSNKLKIFDLKVTGERVFDLDCQKDSPSTRNLIIQAAASDATIIGVTLGGDDVFRGADWPINQFNATLNERRSVMAVTRVGTSDRTLKLYHDNYTFNSLSTALGLTTNSLPALDAVTIPGTGTYSLHYYSPSRFTYPLRTGDSNLDVAGTIPEDKQEEGDYHTETWAVDGGTYTHTTTSPQGADLFGAGKTYQGKGTVGSYEQDAWTFTVKNTPSSIDTGLSAKTLLIATTYTGDLDVLYYSENQNTLTVLKDPQEAFAGHSFPINHTWVTEAYTDLSSALSAYLIYENKSSGNDRVTYKAELGLVN